jgi:hypothetical protein
MDHPTIRRGISSVLPACLALATLVTIGCASPGPPRAPSLHLPQVVSDLTATRSGDAVDIHLTVPRLSTDKLPLYSSKRPDQVLHGSLCRELDHHDCVAVSGIAATLTAADHTVLTLHDSLPPALTTGNPHLLGYRVEFYSPEGRSAGRSEAAYTATGPIPPPVTGLRAAGTRGGILLQWDQTAQNQGEVLLQRTELDPKPKPAKAEPPARPATHKSRAGGSGRLPAAHGDPDETWLAANSATNRTLDEGITADEPYRYVAVRRMIVAVGARTFDLRSEPSAPIDFTLQPIYTPAAPTGLTATGFQPSDSPTAHFAVDLIWQPVDDARITPQLAPPLVGYNIYREELSGDGGVYASRIHLNTAPVPLPAFHDTTAKPAARYRYSVSAIDAKGNESKAATFTLEPSPQ